MFGAIFRASVAFLFVAMAASASAATADDLKLFTEEYPPLTFSRDGAATGLDTEVVEEIMRRLGITAKIEVVPWARGYKLVLNAPNVGLFATTRTPEREKLFKWVGPISATTAHFYSLRGGARFESLDRARSAERILIPREWYLEQMLRDMGFTNIYTVSAPIEAVRMLVGKRAPLMALDDITLADTLSAGGVDPQLIEPGVLISQAVQYIAFSSDAPDTMIARWQKALDDMKSDGSFDRLYEKWLPGVTPPGRR